MLIPGLIGGAAAIALYVATRTFRRGRSGASSLPVETEVRERLGLREIIAWFATARPPHAASARCVLVRESDPCGLRLISVFVTETNEIVRHPRGTLCGRVQRARQLDEELAALFGDRQMVVLE